MKKGFKFTPFVDVLLHVHSDIIIFLMSIAKLTKYFHVIGGVYTIFVINIQKNVHTSDKLYNSFDSIGCAD